MKNILLFCFLTAVVFPAGLNAQINNVTVETYYVSDSIDAADLDGAGGVPEWNLQAGSKTYRIYIDLAPGSRLIQIYGDSAHALKFNSTENFFNNRDRGKSFGFDIDNTKLRYNTVALDTWITLGKASKKHYGVLKANDPNGTILHPNDGGSAGIAGGLLINDDPDAGTPLTLQDGLVHDTLIIDTATLTLWSHSGFEFLGNDTTMFGQDSIRSEFISHEAVLRQNAGVTGPSSSDNKVLVAQLTTKGEISFELNVIVEDASGMLINYVASGSDTNYIFAGQPVIERVSPYLVYPPVCGCTDPRYIEYSPAYACNEPAACTTLIVFGCTDMMACNFNPNANFNIPALCCYPGYCNDRDIAVVCPELTVKRFHLYPNPARDVITLQVSADVSEETKYAIYDSFGRLIIEKNIKVSSGTSLLQVDVSKLNTGVYMFRLFNGDSHESKMFLKK